MTAFFSTAFITALSASPAMINGSVVKMVVFREAPNFDDNDSRYIGKTTVAQLLAMPGWVPVTAGGPPLANTITVGVRDEGKSNYVVFSSFPFTGLAKSEVKAVAFLRPDNTLMFVTNTPFGNEMRVVANGDAVTASPDSTLGAVSNRWLFNWADAPQVGGTIVTISEGPLLLSLGPPTFEPSHTQHVWLYPQRANMIANPSFELASPPTGYWTSNGSISRVALVNPPISAGRFAGQFQYGGVVVAESNTFPTLRQERWTIQLMARGLGDLKIGFVWWDDDFEEAAVDWGEETWPLSPTTFVHISVCRTPVQTYQGMLRLEASGGDLTIDQVLCESGYLKDWAYFDGDTDYGMREDFTWYGGEVRQGASYSLWYNHKKAVYGRMFARQIDGTTLITDEVMREQGIVYEWVPAGTVVVPHMDVLYPNDLQLVVPDKIGVLSYRANQNDLQGIVNPWGIVVDAGLHAHSAGHVTLQVFLVVQSAAHGHIAGNVTTVAVPNTPLVPANAVHAHTAANVVLVQIPKLQGDNAAHAVTSPELILVWRTPGIPIKDGLVGYWDSSDAATFVYHSGNVVSQWLDKSGGNRTLSNTSSAASPTRSGTKNGKATVVGNGTQYLNYVGATGLNVGSVSLFVVAGESADGGWNCGLFAGYRPGIGVNDHDDAGGFTMENGTDVRIVQASRGGSGGLSWSSGTGIMPWAIYRLNLEPGGGMTVYKNNVTSQIGVYQTTYVEAGGYILMGRYQAGAITSAMRFLGEIGEVALYDKVLTGPEIAENDQYLITKWGIV